MMRGILIVSVFVAMSFFFTSVTEARGGCGSCPGGVCHVPVEVFVVAPAHVAVAATTSAVHVVAGTAEHAVEAKPVRRLIGKLIHRQHRG